MACFASSLGFTGIGPIDWAAGLLPALRRAVATVRAGGRALVDVRVERG